MLVNSEMIKDDDKGNKVCLTEKHFTLASLNKEEGRKYGRELPPIFYVHKENSASVYFSLLH